jgi:hypothetical protein
MSQVTLNSLMQQIKTLTIDEQRALNSLLCANIRHASKVKSIQKAMSFEVGQFVEFDGRTRGRIVLEVTGFSRDMSKVKGIQINRGFKTLRGTPWTATATACKAVSAEEAARIKAV